MSENHKYYYMKFKDTFFNDPKILLLEQMQETAKDGCTQSAVSGKQPVPVYQEFDKAA